MSGSDRPYDDYDILHFNTNRYEWVVVVVVVVAAAAVVVVVVVCLIINQASQMGHAPC